MTRILITGGRGFLGRNLAAHLRVRNDCEVAIFDQQDSSEDLRKWLLEADIVFHLAGINRPENPSDF
jgi:UDP-2-acetamido-2,6-beta-L-arabino-hexul-4-ose reductase